MKYRRRVGMIQVTGARRRSTNTSQMRPVQAPHRSSQWSENALLVRITMTRSRLGREPNNGAAAGTARDRHPRFRMFGEQVIQNTCGQNRVADPRRRDEKNVHVPRRLGSLRGRYTHRTPTCKEAALVKTTPTRQVNGHEHIPFSPFWNAGASWPSPGPTPSAFLQGLVTADMRTVSPQRGAYGAMLTPQGKFLHDFFILVHGDSLLIDCDGERADDLLRRMTLHRAAGQGRTDGCDGVLDGGHRLRRRNGTDARPAARAWGHRRPSATAWR